MNKKLVGGLLVGVLLIIILVVMYVFYLGSGPPTGPGPVTAPAPTPSVEPPPAPPAPETVAPKLPPPEVTPSPEVSPPAPEITVLSPEKEKESYGILVGRYRQYHRAATMLERLKKKDLPGFIRRDPRRRRPYEVWAGPFTDPGEAKAARKSLRAMLRRTPKIEKIETPVPK
jgi:cell division septation protein DedD